MKKMYEVIRLIQQNGDYHIIMDCVEGEIWGEYVLKHPNLEKEKVIKWVRQLERELDCITRSKRISQYQFLSPFSVVLKTDGTLALLNLKVKDNQERIDQLLENPSMQIFFSEEEADKYSFAKTIQFLLAKTNLTPKLTRSEEKKFQKLISTNVSINKKNNLKYIMTIIIITIIAFFLVITEYYRKVPKIQENQYYYMGMIYFISMGDYEKSGEIFSRLSNSEKADSYEILSNYMAGKGRNSKNEIIKILDAMTEKYNGQLDADEKCCLMIVYDKIGTEYAREKAREIAKDLQESSEWYKYEKQIKRIGQ